MAKCFQWALIPSTLHLCLNFNQPCKHSRVCLSRVRKPVGRESYWCTMEVPYLICMCLLEESELMLWEHSVSYGANDVEVAGELRPWCRCNPDDYREHSFLSEDWSQSSGQVVFVRMDICPWVRHTRQGGTQQCKKAYEEQIQDSSCHRHINHASASVHVCSWMDEHYISSRIAPDIVLFSSLC